MSYEAKPLNAAQSKAALANSTLPGYASDNQQDLLWQGLQADLKQRNSLQIFCCGNSARGDDGVGPLLHARLALRYNRLIEKGYVSVYFAHQWQIEDALELDSKSVCLFVDATLKSVDGYQLSLINNSAPITSASHSLTPAQLLSVLERIGKHPPESFWQLAVRGYAFELGAELSTEVLGVCERLTKRLDALFCGWMVI